MTAGLVLIVFTLSDGTIAPNGWKTPCTSPSPAHRSLSPIARSPAHPDTPDIIALLILGVLLLLAYIAWEHFLERAQERKSTTRWTPPPVMRVSLWGRGRGMLAVILCLAFLEYGGFLNFSFWIQVRAPRFHKSTGC